MKLVRQIQLKSLFRLALLTVSFWFLFVSFSQAATLSPVPSTGVYAVGSTFTVKVNVNTSGAAINAAEGTLGFNPSELAVVSVAKGSIFGLWAVEPSFSNSAGTVSFGGGSPTGYTGSAGTVISVTFRVKASGTAKVSFKSGSVLAADGLGTNVLTSMGGGTYTLTATQDVPEPEVVEYVPVANTPTAPTVSSATHSDPASWYSIKTAELTWTLPSGVTGVRTALTPEASSVPVKVYDTPISSLTLDDLDEGVQYFHIQFRNSEGWGKVTHYRLAIDTEKPSAFIITPAKDNDITSPTQKLNLEVTETGSGISYYLIKIDDQEPYKQESLATTSMEVVTLPVLDPGYHSVIIEAFDRAGLSIIGTHSVDIKAFSAPIFTEYPSEINEEVIPVIKGMTKPNSTVTVTLERLNSSASAIDYEVKSNSEGEFIFIPESTLTLGVYQLTAVSVDEAGAKSAVSDAIQIAVQQPGYLRLGNFVVGIMSILVPLVALAFFLLFVIVYSLRKLRIISKSVTKETNEALAIVDREFLSLSETIKKQQSQLLKSKKTKKLTKIEAAVFDELNNSLNMAQKKIRTEVSEVDDIIE